MSVGTPPSMTDPATNSTVVISTLVLEHVPLAEFFGFVNQCLHQAGPEWLVLTNMRFSRAGFNGEEESKFV